MFNIHIEFGHPVIWPNSSSNWLGIFTTLAFQAGPGSTLLHPWWFASSLSLSCNRAQMPLFLAPFPLKSSSVFSPAIAPHFPLPASPSSHSLPGLILHLKWRRLKGHSGSWAMWGARGTAGHQAAFLRQTGDPGIGPHELSWKTEPSGPDMPPFLEAGWWTSDLLKQWQIEELVTSVCVTTLAETKIRKTHLCLSL